ncbi:MAG: Cof-type HAD-IIB family hydrolase [Erysipelotrichaceae bacterium]|nr:Cof-type HAD-IIB family hydrolase [Erysipelotrichaceae bacterium]
MTKAIFFDVDNTILSHKSGRIPPSFLTSLDKLRANGTICIVTTGRSLAELRELDFVKYPFDGYILLNGQLCLDSNHDIIYENPIHGKTKELLLEAFNEKRFPVILFEKDGMYSSFINQDIIDSLAVVSSLPPEPREYTGGSIYMASIFFPKDYEVDFEIEGLRLAMFDNNAADLISTEVNKASGIQAMMEAFGIEYENTVAFGDGANDVDMMKCVKLGIAMGNGCDEVKQAADYVTDDIDEDGIEKALLHFGLID